MTQTILDITISLDGYVAGPGPTREEPLGRNGELLHEWLFPTAAWRERHGYAAGEQGPDAERVERSLASLGAQVMGRKMFSGGAGPWEDDANAASWFGEDPPFRMPVFVVTHHAREPERFANGTSYAFVTDGVEAAVARAKEAAGGKDVRIAGGASIASQCLTAGLVDRLDLHIAPLLLGGGTALFDGVDFTRLELVETASSPAATHVSYVPLSA